MSSDWDGDGFNGSPWWTARCRFQCNFNINIVTSINNNFTMLAPDGSLTGGTNDVTFAWNGTTLTSVAISGQASNASLSSGCPFFGVPWQAHDVAIYGTGTYTVYADCPAGAPGCGAGTPITFTVGAGQLGAHILFDWAGNNDIDVVNVWVTERRVRCVTNVCRPGSRELRWSGHLRHQPGRYALGLDVE